MPRRKKRKSRQSGDQQPHSLTVVNQSFSAANEGFKEDLNDERVDEIERERLEFERISINEQTASKTSQPFRTGGHVVQGTNAKGHARTHHGDSYQWNTNNYHVPSTSQESYAPRLTEKLKFEGM